MQLCSGNNYPDCCKHNHLTSAAGWAEGRRRGGGGNIISIGSVRVSADRGGRGLGDMCLFTIEKLHLAHWLQWLRVPSEILDVTDTPGAQAQASLVTFLLASSEIQDNKQRQTVVVQCSPRSLCDMSHMFVMLSQNSQIIAISRKFVRPSPSRVWPQSSLTGATSFEWRTITPELWVPWTR